MKKILCSLALILTCAQPTFAAYVVENGSDAPPRRIEKVEISSTGITARDADGKAWYIPTSSVRDQGYEILSLAEALNSNKGLLLTCEYFNLGNCYVFKVILKKSR